MGHVCVRVRRVTRLSEGCQIELRLILLAMSDEDVMTELMCVAQNAAGRQEVVTHLQLQGELLVFLKSGDPNKESDIWASG